MKKDIYIVLQENLRQKLLQLPDFAADFIESLENTKEIRTRIEYSKDITLFLDYLRDLKGVSEITLPLLETLTTRDIRDFLNYLTNYTKTFDSPKGKKITRTYSNTAVSKGRKLASIHELFSYLYQEELLTKDVSSKVDIKINTKAKIKETLTDEELSHLLKVILEELNIDSEREKVFASKTKYRDYAITLLLAYTGLRVGELVQLDVQDLNLKEEALIVTRKGGDEERIPLPTTIMDDLVFYIKERENMKVSEKALFLSSHKKRLGEKSINNFLDKYGKRAELDFKLTPHVLRRTFGTAHYNTYGDISLTGTLLGHNSTETTKKFYAKVSDKRVEKSMKKFDYGHGDELSSLLEEYNLTAEDVLKYIKQRNS